MRCAAGSVSHTCACARLLGARPDGHGRSGLSQRIGEARALFMQPGRIDPRIGHRASLAL